MKEATTVGQRFTQLITHLGISKNAFAASLDKTATVIQHLVDERNKPGFDLLCKVFEVYPNVSKDWMLQGEGPMLVGAAEAEKLALVKQLVSAPNKISPQAQSVSEAPAATDIEAEEANRAAAPEALNTAPSPEVKTPESSIAAATAPLSNISSNPSPTPATAPVDTSWQTALYTQQMAHQLAMAELRNQHLQEQQRMMQQMLELMKQQMSK